jgi:hypothetical protein
MDPDQFTTSYMNVVLYLSERNPVLAEYLLARFPHFLQMDQDTFYKIKKNTNKWLKKVQFEDGQKTTVSKILPYDVFVDAVYNLARVYTYGTDNVPRNVYRANKFIRILKRLSDPRYEILQKENTQRKLKKMKKTFQQ